MKPNPTPGGSKKQILDDHRQINELMSKVAVLTIATEMSTCLQRLLPLMESHFKKEEDEIDGLHAVIQERAPRLINALQGLKEEHLQLIEAARHLLATTRETEGQSEQLRELGTELKDRLAAHEAREIGIFLDSIWTDLGAGD